MLLAVTLELMLTVLVALGLAALLALPALLREEEGLGARLGALLALEALLGAESVLGALLALALPPARAAL